MKMRWHVCSTLLAAMLLIGSTASEVFAQSGGRAAVIARQRVRASLVSAMADGKLTKIEQHSILLKGKESLSPGEMRGLQSTLDRITGATTYATDDARPTPLASYFFETSDHTIPTGNDAGENATTVAYEESLQATDNESPFQEETPRSEPARRLLPATPLTPAKPTPEADPVQQFQQYCNECAEECGEAIDGCAEGFSFGCMPGVCSDTLDNIRLTTSIDAFKGPMDLDNTNGNFGINFAINGGMAAVRRLGVGIQAGTSGVLSDFHGTQFTDSTIRQQNFTTVGIYRRNPFQTRGVNFGFAFDWLHDKYYASFDMSQWRVQLSYEFNACEEFGILAAIPNDGETVVLGDGTHERFKPVAYGNLFYTRKWTSGSSLTSWVGIAEEPGEFVFGGSGRVALTERLALVGNVNYVLPSAGGVGGQDEEMWNLSLGIELRPCAMTRGCGSNRFAPMFGLANNGTFAIRRY